MSKTDTFEKSIHSQIVSDYCQFCARECEIILERSK